MMQRPYGRFHYLPAALQKQGIEVTQVFIGHRGDAASVDLLNGVKRIALAISPRSLLSFMQEFDQIVDQVAPDWVAGFSDIWCGALARRAAKRGNSQLWLDAYDNFEAYMPWNFPLHTLWHHIIRQANSVTAAGPQLAELLQLHRRGGSPVEVLPMAADPAFSQKDRNECRALLNLPEHSPLLGYVGSWGRSRGTHLLLDAFQRVKKAHKDARLVLSGHPPEYALIEPGVINLGYIPDAQLPLLVNALNVACILTANTRFGQYSYPSKLSEAMACGTPVAASGTEAVRWMLNENPQYLAEVGNADSLASCILHNLNTGKTNYGETSTWEHHAANLYALLSAPPA
jgi:glycosyltransferase involved in cell wall biosynthesis